MTNYEKIIGMNPYDMADWIATILTYCQNSVNYCSKSCPLYNCCNDQDSDNIEDWLNAEYDGWVVET